MTKPKTTAQRVGNHAARRKDAGQVKVSVSVWVDEGDKEAAQSAVKRAAKKFAQPNPDNV